MTRSIIQRFLTRQHGTAAVEMALVAPLLILLMFGAAELGNLFYNQHILAKAVRDGARYAARQPFVAYNMGACTMSNGAAANVRRLVRTAQLATAGASARVPNWPEANEASTIFVTVNCDGSGTYTGVYAGNGNVAATVTVRANLPYTPLIGSMAFPTAGLRINAQSQAAVAGI